MFSVRKINSSSPESKLGVPSATWLVSVPLDLPQASYVKAYVKAKGFDCFYCGRVYVLQRGDNSHMCFADALASMPEQLNEVCLVPCWCESQ